MQSEDSLALLDVARRSIETGLRSAKPLEPDPGCFAPALRALGASFVTLHRNGELRGCTGGLEAWRPLVVDVAVHAFSSAFRDPRFPPLSAAELGGLDIELSILNPPEPLRFASEGELVDQLRPGVDGLVLEEGPLRGTFLPAVWEGLPEPREFLRQLKLKAGLPADYWSEGICVQRYTVESIPGRRERSP